MNPRIVIKKLSDSRRIERETATGLYFLCARSLCGVRFWIVEEVPATDELKKVAS